jgi:hypothetical protein
MAELPGVLDHFYDHVSKFQESLKSQIKKSVPDQVDSR